MNIGLLYGGKSLEHEVSITSSSYVAEKLIKMGHKIFKVNVSKTGTFSFGGKELLLIPQKGFYDEKHKKIDLDLIFPIIHGAYGEDGRIQSLLDIVNIPYISTDANSSMLGMHKHLQYEIFKANNLPILDYVKIKYNQNTDYLKIQNRLSKDLIIKPEAGGSSIGVRHIKSDDPEILKRECEKLFKLDNEIIIQPYLNNVRELTVAIYEDKNEIKVVGPGEILLNGDILDYEQKYDNKKHASFVLNPTIPENINEKIKNLAKTVFNVLGCSIYSRIDFFYHKEKIYINEINTIPGFTPSSYFPALIENNIGIESFLDIAITESLLKYKRKQEVELIYYG